MIDDMAKWIKIITEITYSQKHDTMDTLINYEFKDAMYTLFFDIQTKTNNFSMPSRIQLSVDDMGHYMMALEDVYENVIKTFNVTTHAYKMANQMYRYLYNDEYNFDE